MKQTSSLDALLDALRQSGADIGSGNPFGGNSDERKSGDEDFGGSDQPPRVEVPFADTMAAWGKKAIIIAIIAILIIAAVAYWWFHPPINIHSTDTWMFIAIFILLPLFLFFTTRSLAYKRGTGKYEYNEKKAKRFKIVSYLPVIVLLVAIVGAIASQPFFPGNAEKYANVLQTTNDEFTEDIKEVDYTQIPVIDRDSAVVLGNRTMGGIPEYVSQFEVSPLYSQINYQGSPVRVSPLDYADLFKWLANREQGIPAYVVVNMTTQDTEIVRLGDTPIHYSQSEPLFRNIDRHVQLSYPFYMFDQFAFEIDDDGKPWWICPVQDRTIGLFGGKTIQRVVMCDATTGEMTDLPVDEVPQWVDRVYPADLLVEQYNWSGAYSEGWINSWLGQSGVVQTTPGTNGQLGYNYIAKDDDVWVYSGITSATADNSIIGFVLVNQRTAESHFYSVAGATEDSAMRSAEGQVQHLGYSATFPLLINISGQPTYFMALKDNAGLVKMFAMLDIQRYQNVAVGNTVEECQQAYKALLATNGVELADEGATSITTEAEGTIERIVTAVVDGNSHFYVKLAQDDKLYDFALPRMLAIVGYAEGDAIKFTYLDGDGICPAEEILEPKVSVDPNALIPASDEKQASGAPEAAVGNQAAGSDAQAGATQ
ncbi:MAG: Tat pathway signal sequence [Raoultibacter sp.]